MRTLQVEVSIANTHNSFIAELMAISKDDIVNLLHASDTVIQFIKWDQRATSETAIILQVWTDKHNQ